MKNAKLIVGVWVGEIPLQIAGVFVGHGELALLVVLAVLVVGTVEVGDVVDLERVGLVEAVAVELRDGLGGRRAVLVLDEHVALENGVVAFRVEFVHDLAVLCEQVAHELLQLVFLVRADFRDVVDADDAVVRLV